MGLPRQITLGGKRLRLPFFAATVADDERLWSWKRGLRPEALLVSYDVLRMKQARTSQPLAETLDFDGPVIVDSGGFGANAETDASAVYRLQRAVGASLAIVLDRVAFTTDRRKEQLAAVAESVSNARLIRRRHRGAMTLEAVVQGATPEQLQGSSRALARLHFPVYGVPLGMQAKYRRYGPAVERVAYAVSALPSRAALHALGCGSRTLIAVLAYFGVTIFDARSYYQRALYGDNLKSVTMCALGAPRAKPGCGACLNRRRPGRSLEARADYNLNEILKEVTRVRCAIEESMMDEYLPRRLGRKVFDEISLAVERVTMGRLRLFPFLTESWDLWRRGQRGIGL